MAPSVRHDRNLVGRVNVGDTLTRSAARQPTALALVDGERRWTYAELDAWVNRTAHGLLERGYTRGDALALMAGNRAEFLVTYYACAKIGVVCVPLNLMWKGAEAQYVINHSGARGLVVEEALIADAPEVAERFVIGGSFAALADGQPASTPAVYVEDRDAVSYLYTSGTTSAPKGVVGSHLAITLESMSAVIDMKITPADRLAAMMPLFHTAQLNAFVTPTILAGGAVFLMRGFDAERLLELIERERLTQIFGLPMMYRAMLDHPDISTRDLSSLRLAFYAMAVMPEADLRRCLTVFDCEFALLFGQTEWSPISTIFRPEHQLSHTGAVGTPAASTQVAIMAEDGTLLRPGEIGEIVYRGPNALEGYLNDEEATDHVFRHGWFHSGDVGRLGEDGMLWFEDRKKDVIKSGGENVSSLEVEKALYAAEPRIGEVVVVGLPHPRWTEAITAVVVPREGETLTGDEVLAAVKGALSGFKAPKAVLVCDSLPRTSTGKVQKHVLRQRYVAHYTEPSL
jgi:long-chain acyl-CoA synthetase